MPTAIGLGVIVAGLLAVYGLQSWFFPSSTLELVALLPALAFGIGAARRVWRNKSHPQPRQRSVAVGGFIVITTTTWIAFAMGIPALVANALQANETSVAVVGIKDTPARGRLWDCDFKVGLVGFEAPFKHRVCVSGPNWAHVNVGDRMALLVRSSLFGTHIYGIKKAES